jgi:hypothetical protein
MEKGQGVAAADLRHICDLSEAAFRLHKPQLSKASWTNVKAVSLLSANPFEGTSTVY